MLKHNVHGFSSRSTGLGCWFVSPSMEWKNGGAYNRDLSCHQGGADSLQIMYMNGSHYGGGDAQLKQGENFQKVYGPFLIYLNRANSVQAAWSDAKNMASSEGRKWPYSFVSQPGYVKERGKVTGTLAINNPLTGTRLPLEDAVVTLVQQPSNTEPIPTQQWRHTSHWAHSLNGATPNFVIYAVVPGTYQLRAWSKNVVGEFVLDKLVTVKAGEVTNLGKFTFNENRIHQLLGKSVFQIVLPWNIYMVIISINGVFTINSRMNSQKVLITMLVNLTIKKIGIIVKFLFQVMMVNILVFHGTFTLI